MLILNRLVGEIQLPAVLPVIRMTTDINLDNRTNRINLEMLLPKENLSKDHHLKNNRDLHNKNSKDLHNKNSKDLHNKNSKDLHNLEEDHINHLHLNQKLSLHLLQMKELHLSNVNLKDFLDLNLIARHFTDAFPKKTDLILSLTSGVP